MPDPYPIIVQDRLNRLANSNNYICFYDQDTVCLDGDFSPADLLDLLGLLKQWHDGEVDLKGVTP